MAVQVARRARRDAVGNYGIYNGFELIEHEPIPGREEFINSEKYEMKTRDWNKPGNIKDYLRRLNAIRRANAALLQTANLRFLPVDDDGVIGFLKESVDDDNAVACAIALTRGPHEFWLHFGDERIGPSGARSRCGRSRTWSPASAIAWNGAACGCASMPSAIPRCCSAVTR